ncbi:MAG: hypothetical protein ACRYG8_10235 [Janthinobacterium lividum]
MAIQTFGRGVERLFVGFRMAAQRRMATILCDEEVAPFPRSGSFIHDVLLLLGGALRSSVPPGRHPRP